MNRLELSVTPDSVDEIVAEFRAHDKFLLTTHESPDGDALGSLLAMHRLLGQIGKDSVMFLAAKEFPIAVEYRFLPLRDVFHEAPADMSDRVVVFLDCGNIDRMPVDFLRNGGIRVLNIDHHHDNTMFGDMNLVCTGASCTAEIVWRLAHRLEAHVTPEIANALYVGLVTDTGKFMYDNTDATAHEMAADLIAAGVDVGDTFRRLYERVPVEKLRLLARALDRVESHDGGQLTVTYVTRDDYIATGASEILTEGIVDHIRAIDGTRVAAFVRDKTDDGRQARKVSLRSSDGAVDVSAIARMYGGGGHQRAAGFGTDLEYSDLVELLRDEVARQLG